MDKVFTLRPNRYSGNGMMITDGVVEITGFHTLRDVEAAGLMYVKNSRGKWVAMTKVG